MEEFLSLLQSVGLPTAILVATYYVAVSRVLPWFLKQWEDIQDTQRKKDESQHTYYRTEIASLRADVEADHARMYVAFTESITTMGRLQTTLAGFDRRLEAVQLDVEKLFALIPQELKR